MSLDAVSKNNIYKLQVEELDTLKNFIKENLYKYIYETKDIEEIQIVRFDEAIILYSNGKKEIINTNLHKENWNLLFYYFNSKKYGTIYKENEYLLLDLPGNHRFMGKLNNTTDSAISITIRFFKEDTKTKFKDFKINKNVEEFLKQAVLKKYNIFVSGATSAGKTTFVNLLIKQIPIDERIFAVDDANELRIPHYNKFVEKPNNYEKFLDFILKSTPERLILGELSTKNVHAVEKFLTNGHSGFIMTMHADSPELAITSSFFAKFSKDNKAVTNYERETNLLKERVNLVIQLKQNHKKERVLTDIYFPSEDKIYHFPDDYELFKTEKLKIKEKKPLKHEVLDYVKNKNVVTYKEISSQFNMSYYLARKIIPKEHLRKNVLFEFIKQNKNLPTKNIINKLVQNNIFVSKRQVLKIKKRI